MPRANDAVAALLNEYAELHLMTGGDQFRARSYEKAARSIAGLAEDVSQLGPERLQQIPGVGKAIARKVAEIGETGTFAELEGLRAQIPDGVLQLTRIPALGPRRALVPGTPASRPTAQTRTLRARTTKPAARSSFSRTAPIAANESAVRVQASRVRARASPGSSAPSRPARLIAPLSPKPARARPRPARPAR